MVLALSADQCTLVTASSNQLGSVTGGRCQGGGGLAIVVGDDGCRQYIREKLVCALFGLALCRNLQEVADMQATGIGCGVSP